MPQSVLLKNSGIFSFPNQLSEVPPGAMSVADNCIIDRNGVVESRRGFQQYGTTFPAGSSSNVAYQLMTYKKTLLLQDAQTYHIAYDSDNAGTWIDFAGTYPPAQVGLRTKYAEANGNFYFTTTNGIYCISAETSSQFTPTAGYIRPSGGAIALNVSGTLDFTNGGWFIYQTSTPGQTKVAYRVTWSFYDANGDLVEGAPSTRLVMTNPTLNAADVNLTFQIPSQIQPGDTQYFYNIYRTAISQTSPGVPLATLDPGDEEYLVIQTFPTSGQLAAGVVTVLDNVPDSIRATGALLYTNPVSGQGILQSNYPPPFALDITLYQQTLFFANTQTLQSINLTLLGVVNLISGTSTVTIGGQTYTFVGTKEIQDFTMTTQAGTTDGGYFLINGPSNVTNYFVWYSKSGSAATQSFTFDTFAHTTPGGYFLINSANNTNEFFIWFDTTGSTPEPSNYDTAGRTGVRVPVFGLTTGSDIANAVANALSAITVGGVAQFTATPTSATVHVTNTANGVTSPVVNGATPVDTTGVFQGSLSSTPGTNPLPQPSGSDTVGRLPILVNIQTAVTASDVAVATALAMNGVVDFTATSLGAVVTVTNNDNGPSTTATNSSIVPVWAGLNPTVIHAGTGANPSLNYVLLGGSPSPSQNIAETAQSLVAIINSNPASTVYAFYESGPTDLPGKITIQNKTLNTAAFSITANSTSTGNEFSPALPTSGTSVESTQTGQVNQVYYSKFQQPEAVPTVNYFNVGPKDKAILRILPIRTGLMIFKEDGIYQLTGVNGQFVINPFDSSAILLAPDSAQVLNNQVYMFSTQGITTVTDTGVSVISRPIENQLQQVIAPGYAYLDNTFGVAYESDRAYLMWTVTTTNDIQPTQCFRYNYMTQAWTRWPIVKTCGVVRVDQNILYLGPGDKNFIEQERKNISRTDYADRQYALSIPDNAFVTPTEVTLSSVAQVELGDVLVQTQNLTIAQYNQMLQKLDLDPGPALAGHYYSTLQAVPGVDLWASVNALAAKLDTDMNINPTYPTAYFTPLMTNPDTFLGAQENFNILVTQLNANAEIVFRNFPASSGTGMFETDILETVNNSNNVILQYPIPFIAGPIEAFHGISTNIVWAPQHFGDPSIAKHVSEGTFMFENTDFTEATIAYASDLSPGFESVTFPEAGIGDWGYFIWNNQAWGGNGSQVPIRTYIPRNKQYCRMIFPNFSHIIAREKFAIFGGSLTFRPLTERAYRS
jgi:hypothetical protein